MERMNKTDVFGLGPYAGTGLAAGGAGQYAIQQKEPLRFQPGGPDALPGKWWEEENKRTPEEALRTNDFKARQQKSRRPLHMMRDEEDTGGYDLAKPPLHKMRDEEDTEYDLAKPPLHLEGDTGENKSDTEMARFNQKKEAVISNGGYLNHLTDVSQMKEELESLQQTIEKLKEQTTEMGRFNQKQEPVIYSVGKGGDLDPDNLGKSTQFMTDYAGKD